MSRGRRFRMLWATLEISTAAPDDGSDARANRRDSWQVLFERRILATGAMVRMPRAVSGITISQLDHADCGDGEVECGWRCPIS
jgi:hypothetical protein